MISSDPYVLTVLSKESSVEREKQFESSVDAFENELRNLSTVSYENHMPEKECLASEK